MTAVVLEAPVRTVARTPQRRWLRSGWPPALVLAAATALTLRFYGVPLATTAAFAAYLGAGVVLPGTLVWRALHRGRGWFVADVAAGTALGYALEVLCYIPARAAGLPLLVLAWPVGTVAAFAAVPRLRRYWRCAPGADRPPALWSWALAGAIGGVVFWSVKVFRRYGLAWPYNANVDTDSPFHLALIGEAKHHLPLVTPWASSEPLYYHWFVYAEMAATSWVTGIEPLVLLYRLSMLPMLAAFVVLVAVLARRLFGGWWTGIAAVVGTLFVQAPNPYGWDLAPFFTGLGFNAVDDGSALRVTVWTSPTQTFGALLFVPVVLILVDLFAGKRGWLPFAVLLCALMGAKATYLPVLLGGLLVVLVVRLVARKRPDRTLLGALGITAACLLFAHVVLFGGTTQGLKWDPLADMKIAGVITTELLVEPDRWRLLLIAAIAAWCWVCMWAGIAGLRRRPVGDAVVLLLGIGVVGIAATVLLGQSGDSQRFFIESARPYLTLAAVGGLAAVLPATRRGALGLVAAIGAGFATIHVIRRLDGPLLPTPRNTPGPKHLAFEVAWPYLLTVAVAAALALAVFRARRRLPALALVVGLLAGFGLATASSNAALLVREAAAFGWRDVRVHPPADRMMPDPIVSRGTLEAGRWLRDHSDPDDLVATNAHCLPARYEQCVDLHFAIAGYSERRVLVEGWGFTTTAHVEAARQRIWVGFVPYWRPDVLAANDAVFTAASPTNVALLRDRYGVKWLFVDLTRGGSVADLAQVAELRFRSGDCAVLEIHPSR